MIKKISNFPRANRGFTLIELLVVVLIISIAYGLVFYNFRLSPSTQKDAILGLKDKLLSMDVPRLSVRCRSNDCATCELFSKNKKISDFELFDSMATTYVFDDLGNFSPLLDLMGQKECFRFDVYDNKSTSQLFVEYKGAYYIFNSLWQTKKYTDVQEAKDVYDARKILPIHMEDVDAF